MKVPGPYEATVLADSTAYGTRLTTLAVTFPRIVLAEFNTHRVFSRNSASSRAIPVRRRIEQIRANPYVPLSFGKNKRGMQAKGEEVAHAEAAREHWLHAMQQACDRAESLATLGLHKQWANRIIEPYAWHTVIVSATEWDNYFAQRDSPNAQPEIAKASEAMRAAMEASTPKELQPGQWHLPCIGGKDWRTQGMFGDVYDELVRISVARCAAISYGRIPDNDLEADLKRYERMRSMFHMSPFEHAAEVHSPTGTVEFEYVGEVHEFEMPFGPTYRRGPVDGIPRWIFNGYFCGNFRAPWVQHRKMIAGEFCYEGE